MHIPESVALEFQPVVANIAKVPEAHEAFQIAQGSTAHQHDPHRSLTGQLCNDPLGPGRKPGL
jgi:hypothetical protein